MKRSRLVPHTDVRGKFDRTTPVDPVSRKTVRRIDRLKTAIDRRQIDLHLVLENVHDPHNISAVMRSCEAVGLQTLHLVYTVEDFPKLNRSCSAGAFKWIDIVSHESIEECYAFLRQRECRIYATHLRESSTELYELELTGPVAIVLGNENRGLTEEATDLADGTFYVPMAGLVESLNISVACGVILFEALRQRLEAGSYERARLDPEIKEGLLNDWMQR